MKKTILIHFLLFFTLFSINSCQVNSNVHKNKEGLIDYSGNYILEGKTVSVPAKDSYDKQESVQRYNEMLYIRLKDIYAGEYEMSWRVLPETHQPESVEAVKVIITQDGKISSEFKCDAYSPLILRPRGEMAGRKGKFASSGKVGLSYYDRDERGTVSGEITAVSQKEFDATQRGEIKVDYRQKCIFEGSFLSNKKLTVHYLIKDYQDVLIFEGWRDGVRERVY